MWHATFANSLKTAEIPKDVAEILRKSLLLSSESSQGGSLTSNIGPIDVICYSVIQNPYGRGKPLEYEVTWLKC